MPSRPIRSTVENVTENIPNGPLGFAGNGNLLGFSGMVVTGISRTIVPGSELDPGYRVRSEEIKRSGGTERHVFKIDAYSKNIAQTVAKIRSAPSAADFFGRETQVVNVIEATPRRTASTWKVTVQVQDRSLLSDD